MGGGLENQRIGENGKKDKIENYGKQSHLSYNRDIMFDVLFVHF
jgi:hypothetical protein